MTWLFGHWSRVYQAVISDWQALIRGLCTHWSGGWSGTDHLTAHAVITWLVVHWSRVYHTVITWLRGADHVTVPSVITWLSRHWYRDWACTDHVPGAGEAFHSGQRSWGRRLGIRKGGIELQESPWKFSSIYPQNQSLPTFCLCFHLNLWLYGGLSPTTSLWKKS